MPDNRNQTPPTRERLDKAVATLPQQQAPVAIDQSAGGMLIQNAEQAMDVAHAMSKSGVAVRPFMREKPGVCLAVVIQAIEWRMSPFAVAQKAYSVNDQLAYESQLIQAVILSRAPIKGRIKFDFEGEGVERRCRAWAVLDDREASFEGETVEYWSPKWKDISPKNSPLWKNDPDQQFSYFSGRGLSRRHFPDVLLGIVSVDEMQDTTPMHNGRPIATQHSTASKLDRLAATPADDGRTIEADGPAPADRRPGDVADAEAIAQERDVSSVARAAEAVEEAGGQPFEADAGDGAVDESEPDEDEGFPGDAMTPKEKRRAEVLVDLRSAATDGGKALDVAAGKLSEADLAMVSEDEQRSIRAIADEVDSRATKRGGKR